jgi:hypothetical protein
LTELLSPAPRAAFQALDRTMTETALWNLLRENPDLNVLQKEGPEQWQTLIEEMRL